MPEEIRIVTAAIIKKDGKYLISQRPKGASWGLTWEFPGGKLEPEETLQDCLRREIKEELNIRIRVGKLFGVSSDVYNQIRHIVLLGFLCKFVSGQIKKSVKYTWVTPAEMAEYDFCKADIVFVKKLQSGLS